MLPSRLSAAACRTILPGIAILTGLLGSAPARATGFGEISLHSRIGENLLAEVPLLGVSPTLRDAGCYRLVARPGGELPTITRATLKLIHNGENYRLLIIGPQAISEPIFAINLRTTCGPELARDFILMPEAPRAPAEIVEMAAPAQGSHDSTGADESTRRETFVAPRRAPPETRRNAAPVSRSRSSPGPGAEPRPAKRSARRTTGDRLLLGAPPGEPPASDKPAPLGTPELEQRLLRMETSLRSLNQEMDALHGTLKLSTEMQAARHELQAARQLQSAVAGRAPTAAEGPRRSTVGDWLALVLSSLLGGLLAVGIAAAIEQRKKKRGAAS